MPKSSKRRKKPMQRELWESEITSIPSLRKQGTTSGKTKNTDAHVHTHTLTRSQAHTRTYVQHTTRTHTSHTYTQYQTYARAQNHDKCNVCVSSVNRITRSVVVENVARRFISKVPVDSRQAVFVVGEQSGGRSFLLSASDPRSIVSGCGILRE